MSEASTDRHVDGARAPREGETLDVEALAPYLREQLAVEGELVVEQFPSGFSNLTYLLRLGDLELVLRRPPFGNRVATAHDMAREHRVLSALVDRYPLAPKPYLYCDDDEILGAPFYVMERRRGVILRRQPPLGLDLGPEVMDRLSKNFIDEQANLHLLDYVAAGLGDLGKPEGYVERQVAGWIERYERARTHDWPELEQVAAWLRERLDEVAKESNEARAALVHNDYKYDNLVLDPSDPTRLVAVLDWEMCTVGDPRMDLGTTLSYWVEPEDPAPLRAAAFGPTALPGSWTRRRLAQRWAEKTGADLSNLVFYVAFGRFKLAGIVQQIYWRYAQGHTRDPRFAELHQLVDLLGKVALAQISRDRY